MFGNNFKYEEGAIMIIYPTQEYSNFKKREFVIKTEGAYPEELKFEFRNELVDVLDNYMEGEMVTVGFVLRGNFFNGKYYVQAEAAGIGPIIEGRIEEHSEIAKTKVKMLTEVDDLVSADNIVDDLPF